MGGFSPANTFLRSSHLQTAIGLLLGASLVYLLVLGGAASAARSLSRSSSSNSATAAAAASGASTTAAAAPAAAPQIAPTERWLQLPSHTIYRVGWDGSQLLPQQPKPSASSSASLQRLQSCFQALKEQQDDSKPPRQQDSSRQPDPAAPNPPPTVLIASIMRDAASSFRSNRDGSPRTLVTYFAFLDAQEYPSCRLSLALLTSDQASFDAAVAAAAVAVRGGALARATVVLRRVVTGTEGAGDRHDVALQLKRRRGVRGWSRCWLVRLRIVYFAAVGDDDPSEGPRNLMRMRMCRIDRTRMQPRACHQHVAAPPTTTTTTHAHLPQLAAARNFLLTSALADEQGVLWLDADIAEAPPGLLRAMAASGRDAVVPIVRDVGGNLYDRNTWAVSGVGAGWVQGGAGCMGQGAWGCMLHGVARMGLHGAQQVRFVQGMQLVACSGVEPSCILPSPHPHHTTHANRRSCPPATAPTAPRSSCWLQRRATPIACQSRCGPLLSRSVVAGFAVLVDCSGRGLSGCC